MRKAIILIAGIIFTCSLTLQAQTERGRFVIGANSNYSLMGADANIMSIGFSTVKNKSDADGYEEPDPDKISTFNMIPKLGIFVANNLLIGIDVSIAYQKSERNRVYYSSEYTRTLLAAGPYIRYYIPAGYVKPFMELSGSYGMIKTIDNYEDEDGFKMNDEYENQLTSIGGGFGVAIPIGSKVNFDILANYTSFTTKAKEDNDDNYRTVVGTFGIRFGFVVFLGN